MLSFLHVCSFLILLSSIDDETERVGLQFKAKYENHGMEKFDGWNNLKTSDDRTEWLNGINGDDDLNIRMFVK